MILCVSFWIVAALNDNFGGKVTTELGEPLSGVSVCVSTWECMVTAQDGRFSVGREVVRFTSPGYRPITRVLEAVGDSNIVMPRDGKATWQIPSCAGVKERKAKELGGKLRISLAKGIRTKGGHDVDYWYQYVQYSTTEYLQLGGGPTWSTGLPGAKALRDSVEISDRDLVLPRVLEPNFRGLIIDGVDVRGTYANGRRWRFVGDAFQTIKYDNASIEAAAFFDSVIEGVCYSGSDAIK